MVATRGVLSTCVRPRSATLESFGRDTMNTTLTWPLVQSLQALRVPVGAVLVGIVTLIGCGRAATNSLQDAVDAMRQTSSAGIDPGRVESSTLKATGPTYGLRAPGLWVRESLSLLTSRVSVNGASSALLYTKAVGTHSDSGT